MSKLVRDLKALHGRDDCVYFNWEMIPSCCGRVQKVGRCTVPDDAGRETSRTCFTALPYCKFTPLETSVSNG